MTTARQYENRMVTKTEHTADDYAAAVLELKRKAITLTRSANLQHQARGQDQLQLISQIERIARQHARQRIRSGGGRR